MVLDIDRFRPKKGGNPQEVRKNQKNRFLDESMVDKIIEADEKWIKARFDADNCNKLKNLASKVIGEKMKVSWNLTFIMLACSNILGIGSFSGFTLL